MRIYMPNTTIAYLILGIFIVAVSNECLRAQETVSPNPLPLSPPIKTISSSFMRSKSLTPPLYDHQHFIQFKHHSISSEDQIVYLFDSSGQSENTLTIWPKGISGLFLTSVDVGAGQQLVYAGTTMRSEGGNANFIAVSDLRNKNPIYFNTGSYLATQIAQAEDGSVWAVGAEHSEAVDASSAKWKNYGVLRHYDVHGKLLEELLPRWEDNVAYVTGAKTPGIEAAYDIQGNPTTTGRRDAIWGYQDAWRGSRQVYLRSVGSQTILYDGVRNLLCKHDSAARTFSCGSIAGTNTQTFSRTTGFALLSDGNVVASFRSPGSEADSLTGLFLLTPRTSASQFEWTEVPGTKGTLQTEGGFLSILGVDHTALIYRRIQSEYSQPLIYESSW